ncbi:MAG TPA: DUF354 domain-containing protein [Bacteroidales bacterium]|nr:DUF354 domain-containing protein [Bacteroidales bacterium]HSA42060.1 DUF354 domain-containing protein [Bacteroidales bacterium]
MKILIDLGHPAHVHYFRNFVRIMQEKGHHFLFTARDKEVLHQLLERYGIPYVNRGKGRSSMSGKAAYILYADAILLREALRFKPDLFLSFASPYAAHVSRLVRKPHITFDDTEHARLAHRLYEPFTDVILSPDCFLHPFSRKQLFFRSYMEMCHLHPSYFRPDASVPEQLSLKAGDPYVILRFVSWQASHDIGQSGLSAETRKRLVHELSRHARVFISSEGALPAEFEPYKLNIQPQQLHHLLAFASLYIGEGSTTASECSVLGTPNIYVNSLVVGYCREQEEKYGLCQHFTTDRGVVEKALELLTAGAKNEASAEGHRRLLADKIDPTTFMVWFVENYPSSVTILKDNPDFQLRFR